MAIWRRSRKFVERRRAPRFEPASLVAHYWTGGLPEPRPVRDIGLFGAMVQSAEPYYPGTVIRMALESRTEAQGTAERTEFAGIWARVLRNVSEGFCVEFIFGSRSERRSFREFLEQVERLDASDVQTERREKG